MYVKGCLVELGSSPHVMMMSLNWRYPFYFVSIEMPISIAHKVAKFTALPMIHKILIKIA